ncbi:MAG: hypothetical protein IPH98_19490 [Saprospiraceae bacterium]|nr:hypothetical protein [Candidatus Defluviibacterium haderslevense]
MRKYQIIRTPLNRFGHLKDTLSIHKDYPKTGKHLLNGTYTLKMHHEIRFLSHKATKIYYGPYSNHLILQHQLYLVGCSSAEPNSLSYGGNLINHIEKTTNYI